MLATIFVAAQLDPLLLLRSSTPAGGDMGAHVWAPAFLRDQLLSDWTLSGWSTDWYAGFPAFRFYMVVPSLAIAVGSWILPYGVAFKLVAVSGVVAMPVAAFTLGRLARLSAPIPGMLAVATLPFLFDRHHTILGGNLPATLAGEFAYTISLALALVYVGLVLRGLSTGRGRAPAAVVLALVGLCHPLPALWALVVTAVAFVIRPSLAALRWLALVLPVAGLLAAFWILPFWWRRAFLNDMGWEKDTTYWDDLTRLGVEHGLGPVLVLAVVATVIGWVLREQLVQVLSTSTLLVGLAVVLLPQGRIWNARLLPFLYLSLYLLAALAVGIGVEWARAPDRRRETSAVIGIVAVVLGLVGVASALRLGIGSEWSRRLGDLQLVSLATAALLTALAGARLARPHLRARIPRLATLTSSAPSIAAGVFCLVVVLFVSFPLRVVPLATTTELGLYGWPGVRTADVSFVPSWVQWNFTGYEAKAGDETGGGYAEYRDLVSTMSRLGDEQGCGRAFWEYDPDLDRYGTPMALMLLPHWTDGCVGSMEGLYFESSATVPYHFVMQAELSSAPSRAMRGIEYPSFDIERGIDHLQLMGVRWYMAFSEQAVAAARSRPELVEVAVSGPWVVFAVDGSQIVESLDQEPVVVRGMGDGADDWLDPTLAAFQGELAPEVLLTGSGPPSWPRVEQDDLDRLPAVETVAAVPSVTDVVVENERISFAVDRPGSPVLVKTSYFPNWRVDGADGPYRAGPNLMVVVPTSTGVELRYGATAVERVATGLSVVGLVGVGVLVWLDRRAGRASEPSSLPSRG